MSNMRVAVGKKPGWEVGKGEKDLEKVDVEKVDGEEKELKTISEVSRFVHCTRLGA